MVSSFSLLPFPSCTQCNPYLQWFSGATCFRPITSGAICGQPCDAYLHLFVLYSRTHQNKKLVQSLEMLTEMSAPQSECGLELSDDHVPMDGPEDKISGHDIF